MNHRTLLRVIIGLVVAGALALAGSAVGFIAYSYGSSASIVSNIEETGSSALALLFAEWSPAYHGREKQVVLSPASTNSGTGITDAQKGLVAIGAADLPAGNVKGLLSIPITVAGVAVAYNVPGLSAVNLDGNVLAGIYSGRITRWDSPFIRALNPGAPLPPLRIRPLERSDSSGTTFQFTSYLQAQSPWGWPIPAKIQDWPAGTGEQGSNAMISACAQVKGCISYVGVSYEDVAVTQYHLRFAALADGATGKYQRFLLPTRANIALALAGFPPGATVLINARYGYPIVNYEYAIVRQHQASGQAAASIRAFLDWAVTSGSTGSYLRGLNFEPLPAGVLASAQHRIGEIR